MQRVRGMAKIGWRGHEPVRHKVEVVVTYYHPGAVSKLDNDNMVKPILDALSSLVYADDRQVADVRIVSVGLEEAGLDPHLAPLVAKRMKQGGQFVHLVLDVMP